MCVRGLRSACRDLSRPSPTLRAVLIFTQNLPLASRPRPRLAPSRFPFTLSPKPSQCPLFSERCFIRASDLYQPEKPRCFLSFAVAFFLPAVAFVSGCAWLRSFSLSLSLVPSLPPHLGCLFHGKAFSKRIAHLRRTANVKAYPRRGNSLVPRRASAGDQQLQSEQWPRTMLVPHQTYVGRWMSSTVPVRQGCKILQRPNFPQTKSKL